MKRYRHGGSWYGARWSRGLLVVCGLTIVFQFAFFGLLSPGGENARLKRPMARHRWAGEGGMAQEDWLWLLHPGLLLLPSANGFSGSAWLVPAPSEVPVETSNVRPAPLPFSPPPIAASWAGLVPRAQDGLADRWGVPALPAEARAASLPLPAQPAVRIAAGLTGWRLVSVPEIKTPMAEAFPRPASIRVWLDERGEIAGPPTLWESSGVAAADELARDAVARAHFERMGPAPEITRGTGVWGLIVVEWSVPAARTAGS